MSNLSTMTRSEYIATALFYCDLGMMNKARRDLYFLLGHLHREYPRFRGRPQEVQDAILTTVDISGLLHYEIQLKTDQIFEEAQK